MHRQIAGKDFPNLESLIQRWRYFSLINTMVMWCFHCRQNNVFSLASFSEPVRYSLCVSKQINPKETEFMANCNLNKFNLLKFWGVIIRNVRKLKYTRYINMQIRSSFLKATLGLSMYLLISNEMYHLSFRRQWLFCDQIKNPQGFVC